MTGNVADDDRQGTIGRHEGVIPVSTDLSLLRGWQIPDRDLQMIGLQRLRQ